MTKLEKLKAEMVKNLEAARAVAARVESAGRDFTKAERAEVTAAMEQAKALKDQVQALQGDADLIGAVRDFGSAVGIVPDGTRKAETWGDVVTKALTERASSTGLTGAKALVAAGSVQVPQPFTGGILNTPRRSNFVQDLLRRSGRVKQIEGTDRFSFWRQTARTFAAAPVAPGALKPTSTITIERAEDRARVIAHLSEPIAEQDIADMADLQSFVNSEMELGLAHELAAQIISGSGLGENLTGIRNANGAQVHSRGTDDLLVALRKARTKLETQDVPLDGMVLCVNPADAEALDLMRDNNGQFYFQGPRDGDADQVWHVPIVPTKEMPAGEQVLMDLSAVELVEREKPTIAIGQPGDMFQRNQVQVRAEGRYGLAIERAFLIVRITA